MVGYTFPYFFHLLVFRALSDFGALFKSVIDLVFTLNKWHGGLAVQHTQFNHHPDEYWGIIFVIYSKINSEPTGVDQGYLRGRGEAG